MRRIGVERNFSYGAIKLTNPIRCGSKNASNDKKTDLAKVVL
jgi:hypothetical protein